jgi:broad specificity phosphatase PhoE
MDRLLLVRAAATRAVRRAVFAVDEPLDAGGLRAAGRLGATTIRRVDAVVASPAVRARQTAEAAGWAAVTDADLAAWDLGGWAGLDLEEVGRRDPTGLRSWLEEPTARPHGGESRAELLARVGRFLDAARDRPGTIVAVTHGAWIRAAVQLAFEAPARSFWRVDVAPASLTKLRRRERGWLVARVNWTVA